MSVYIKGMEMPKSCKACQLERRQDTQYDFEFRCCPITGAQTNRYFKDRHDDCPLIPVPDHGDLIEREPLRASIKESIDECHKWAEEVNEGEMYARVSQSLGTFVECSLRIKAAPTIIPASKEDGE